MIADLIYDVGLHNGDDTAYYLGRGFRVVAIDANRVMIERARERFSEAIDAGRLTLVNAAIFPVAGEVEFYVSDHDDWSSVSRANATRRGASASAVKVPACTFESVLREHGSPYYLKIDIETLDGTCIDALESLSPADRPRYVSWEAHFDTPMQLNKMRRLGYDSFKCIRQTDFRSALWEETHPGLSRLEQRVMRRLGRFPQGPGGFEPGSSGPFGEETDGRWRDYLTAMDAWLNYLSVAARGEFDDWKVWFDFHARLNPSQGRRNGSEADVM